MTQMTEIERLEAQVKCRKMVEGTDLKWWQVVKTANWVWDIPPCFNYSDKNIYELALAVIEGKPVWIGSELYFKDHPTPTKVAKWHTIGTRPEHWSWTPKKPEITTPEFLTVDADALLNWLQFNTMGCKAQTEIRIIEALKKALEELK